jgi:Phage gp6-like head-tail connector protein
MAVIATLAQAKAHLRLSADASANDADVELKLQQATAIIVDYLKDRADAAWTPYTVPGPVQSATLLMLTHLYEHRGDEPSTDDALWLAISRLLMRLRDPAVA